MSGRDAREKCGQPLDLVLGIVESRDQQRDDLDPDAHVVQRADRVQDRLDPAAKLRDSADRRSSSDRPCRDRPTAGCTRALVGVPLPFDTYAGHQAHTARFLEDRDRPFAGDERLVVGADDDLSAEPLAPRLTSASGDASIGGEMASGSLKRLRRHPVLAVGAVQIAPEHAEAECQRSRDARERTAFFRSGSHWMPPTYPQGTRRCPPRFMPHLADADRASGIGHSCPHA